MKPKHKDHAQSLDSHAPNGADLEKIEAKDLEEVLKLANEMSFACNNRRQEKNERH